MCRRPPTQLPTSPGSQGTPCPEGSALTPCCRRLGRAAGLTHRTGQGHIAGPLLSQGLMHGESCPAALANDAASGVPGSGRPEEHPTPWQPLPVSLRERLPGFVSCSSSAASSSPLLFSLPPLLPPSGMGGSSIGGPALVCACARPPSPLTPPS